MCLTLRTLTPVIVLLLTVSARAAAPPAPAGAISKFVGADTLVITHIDLTRVDPKASADQILLWLNRMKLDADAMDHATRGLREGSQMMVDVRDKLTKAGCKRLYILTTLFDVPFAPGVLVAITEPGADAQAISDIFARKPAAMRFGGKPWPEKSEVVPGAVLFGFAEAIDRAKASAAAPKPRPEVMAALAGINDLPIQIVLVPTADTRRVVETLVPRLPATLGGGPSTIFTRGIQWAAAGFDLGDQPAFKLIIQSADAPAANALHAVAVASSRLALADKRARAVVPTMPQLIDTIIPKVEGDRLVLSLDEQGLAALVDGLAPALAAAREHARLQQSSSHVRQIVMACMLYANDNKNQWPDTLEQVIPRYGGHNLLINPRRPDEKIGYVYHKPDPKALTGTTVVVHEKTEGFNKVVVGFADGHTEVFTVEELEKALKPPAP